MSCLPTSEPEKGFEDLIAQIAGGSEAAVWELLERYSKNILRVVRRHLPAEIRGKVDSTDMVQSVWKSLLRHPSRMTEIADPERFVAYLAGMARLKVLETHRHFTQLQAFNVRREVRIDLESRTHRPGEPAGGDPMADRRSRTPSSIASAREKWSIAVSREGIRGGEILQLRLQGLTHREIANRLALSESTVRRTLHSMLQSLTT